MYLKLEVDGHGNIVIFIIFVSNEEINMILRLSTSGLIVQTGIGDLKTLGLITSFFGLKVLLDSNPPTALPMGVLSMLHACVEVLG